MNTSEKDAEIEGCFEKYQGKAINEHQTCSELEDEEVSSNVTSHFTFRAAVLGAFTGCIALSGNIYLGLRTGFAPNISMFGTIAGFGVLKSLSSLPRWLGGGKHYIYETCIFQTAASAASGMGYTFYSGIPAMFRMNLLPPLDECWPMLMVWIFAGSAYGLFFAIPLRKYFVIQQQLIFPTQTAVAHTIRTLHQSNGTQSSTQLKWIIHSFCGSFLLKLVGFFVPTLGKIHIFYWIGEAANSASLKAIATFWNWNLEISTAFFGTGIMLGLNTSLSLFIGSIFVWGILGPLLIKNQIVDSQFGFPTNGVTVQSWSLWVGIVIIMASSLSELLVQCRTIFQGGYQASVQLSNFIMSRIGRRGSTTPSDQAIIIENISISSQVVPVWMWSSGMLVSVVSVIILLHNYFELGVGMGVLAVVMGFLFSLVGCQCYGTTDVNPVGVLAKGSQMVFAALPAPTLLVSQVGSICAGTLSSTCSLEAVNMVGDLKSGHLLNVSPRAQFYAQLIGSSLGGVMAILIFFVFSKAYPCILMDSTKENLCAFKAPMVESWVGVTRALTTDIGKFVPYSCRIACLTFGLFTILITLLKTTVLKKHKSYLPNMNGFGIAFFIPAPGITFTILAGALLAHLMSKIKPEHWKTVGIILAAGLISGEGVSGVFIALLNIFGLKQENVATSFGCPSGSPSKC